MHGLSRDGLSYFPPHVNKSRRSFHLRMGRINPINSDKEQSLQNVFCISKFHFNDGSLFVRHRYNEWFENMSGLFNEKYLPRLFDRN